jgi:transcriptional regulator with XRE-family HTH domain
MNHETTKKQIIANRLAEARKMAGLSQGQVARMMGLHRPTISEIEAGHRNVTATEIAQFAEIYDVAVNWLMGEGAEKLDLQSDRLQLAFRELQKLKADDLDKLMKVLAALREDKGDA